MDLAPADAVAHYNLGIVLRKAGRWAEARGSLRASLLLDPTYDRAQTELTKVETRDPLRMRQGSPPLSPAERREEHLGGSQSR